MKRLTLTLCALLPVLLAACAHQPEMQYTGNEGALQLYRENEDQFGTEVDVLDIDNLFQLTPEQVAAFNRAYQRGLVAGKYSDEIIFDYLKREIYDFNYRADTFVAAHTLEAMEGNCLSLAILTTALAKLTDIRVRYELVDATPVFDREDDVIEVGVHVRSKLFRPAAELTNVVFGTTVGTVIDYFPQDDSRFLDNVTQEEFVAMYYNNIAVDLVAKGDIDSAYWYSRKALELAPDYAPHINTMAVIQRRKGAKDQAEKIYRYALSLDTDKLVILKNYRALMQLQGRDSEARELDIEIAKIDDPNPYVWINLGDEAFAKGQFVDAKKYYKKSIEVAPYVQEGYFGMAKIWYQLGNLDKTREMILQAMANNYKTKNELRYQAKLKMLDRESNHGG